MQTPLMPSSTSAIEAALEEAWIDWKSSDCDWLLLVELVLADSSRMFLSLSEGVNLETVAGAEVRDPVILIPNLNVLFLG